MSKGFVLSDQIINNDLKNPAFDQINIGQPSDKLNDLDLFTKGQPFNLYKELRDNAPIFFHEPMPMDPEPGYWALTRYQDIKHVSIPRLWIHWHRLMKKNRSVIPKFFI
jgi:hypothetical protein